MVRVPQYEGPQVRPTPLRAEQNIRAPEAAFGGATAQAVSQAGQQMGQVASLLDRRAEEHGKEDAELAAFNAYTAASEQSRKYLYEGDGAVYNRRGGQAIGSTSEGAVELKKIGDDTGGSLSSPYAQQQFTKLWARHQDSEMDAISRHEAGQRREYKDQVTAGVVATSQNNAVLRYNDEGEVNSQIGLAELAIRANSKGLPPEQVDAQVLKMRSGIQKAVVLRMATDNPLAANEYYKAHADSFDADDNVTLQRTLEPTLKRADAQASADGIIRRVTKPAGSLYEAVESVESNGRGDAVSGKGAKGVMQVLDSTGQEVAKTIGVPWQPELMTRTTPEAIEYQRKIGRAYLDQQRQAFGNNTTLALAAYNAGPGKVAEWLQQFGDPRDGKISEEAWLAKIPIKETRDYVSRVTSRLTSPSENIPLTEALRINAEENAGDPEKRENVEQRILRENGVRESARRDREQQSSDKAWAHMQQGGSYDTLPPEILRDMPATLHQSLQSYEARRAAGAKVKTDRDAYLQLSDLAGKDQDAFIATDLNQYRDKLSDEDWQHFSDIRRSLQAGGERAAETRAGERTRDQIATQTLNNAGYDPTPKPGTSNAASVKLFQDAFGRAIIDWKANNPGKKPGETEMVAIADRLIIQGALKGSGTFFDDKKRIFELTPEDVPKFQGKDLPQVPPEIASRMHAAFKKANGREPTGAELLSDSLEYLRSRAAQ
jgi:soluble lytic murein transglycosylase-like protein